MTKVKIVELEKLYDECNDREIISLSVGNGENKFSFEVKHRLSEKEVSDVVETVCRGVFDMETGTYRPELRDYFLRIAVLKAYTNLTLPKGAKSWNLVYGTPIFAMITGHDRRPIIFNGRDYDDNMVIDVEQYEQILAAIDQRITYAVIQKGMTDAVITLQKFF